MSNFSDNLRDQIVNITKAHAYDIAVEQIKELNTENNKLRARVKYLEDLIMEYVDKMKVNLSGPSGSKVNQFLKDQNKPT